MSVSSSSVLFFQRDPKVITANIDNELVMMSIEKGQYYGLSGVGPRVWELLAEPMTIEEVSYVISKEYDVDDNLCHNDVRSFIDGMVSIGVVSIVDGGYSSG